VDPDTRSLASVGLADTHPPL